MAVIAACSVPHPPVIVPAVGHGEERAIRRTTAAYEDVAGRLAEAGPDTLVIMSPHATAYADYFHISPGTSAHGDLAQFDAPAELAEVDYDAELATAISEEAQASGIPAGTSGERERDLDHGTMVPLHFICQHIPRPRIVRIGLSGLPPLAHYHLGQAIARAADRLGRRIAFVASGDLSHRLRETGPYGYDPAGPTFDRIVCKALSMGAFGDLLAIEPELADAAGECGLRSLITMAGALDGRRVGAHLLSYEGPFGVGYAVAWFDPGAPDESRRFAESFVAESRQRAVAARAGQDPLVRLARLSLEHRIETGRAASWPDGVPADLAAALPPEATGRQAGTFVSLHMDGRLRGCIGTIAPTEGCVAAEVMRNAVSAGLDDPRFPPVTAGELDRLVYSVDVLGAPERIMSENQLDCRRYGVIVTNGHRRGLLLPDLDGVDDVRTQVRIARRKAGIAEGEPYELERFEVVRHT